MRKRADDLGGGATRLMSRSISSWRALGGSWPSLVTASRSSSGRRSASASDAFIIWRNAGLSCG